MQTKGGKIVFNDTNEEFLNKELENYRADGIDAKGYVCDVIDEDAINGHILYVNGGILAYIGKQP